MANLTFENDARLVLSDGHGVYIPQLFCDGMDESDARRIGVDFEDIQICQSGPDHEWYWESWQAILDSAEVTDQHGNRWGLLQNGDLWEYPIGCDIPEMW